MLYSKKIATPGQIDMGLSTVVDKIEPEFCMHDSADKLNPPAGAAPCMLCELIIHSMACFDVSSRLSCAHDYNYN